MAETRKLAKEEYLFKDGDAPDNMYLIKSGLLAVTKSKNNAEVIIAEIGQGAMVGEMALFDRKNRSANVKALKESEVVVLPYKSLETQLNSLPEWIKAIIRTLNENLRDANQRIKQLGQTETDEDRFPPHLVNKLLSIVNMVGHKYGRTEPEGLVIPSGTLRKYTIQIFQEPTNKMQSLVTALKDLKIFEITDLGEGKQKMVNKKPDFLFNFVDWYNDWLFKPEKERIQLNADEVRILNGIIHFAKKVQPNGKGIRKVNLDTIQNDSMKEIGALIRYEDFKTLIEKGLCSEKIMETAGNFIELRLEDLENLAEYFGLITTLKRLLR